MDHSRFSRREFLGVGAGLAGMSLAGTREPHREILLEPTAQPPVTRSAADRVRFGMIGVGMQGAPLLSTAIGVPNVECVAAADLYDGRHTLAREIVRPDLPTTRRYQELLDNKEIDAVVVAVPDHWHRQIVVDALNAGKDVYCEKPLSHTAADGVAMLDAATKTGRVTQVGSQRVSSAVFQKAREMVKSGMLGDLTLIEGWNGRNEPSGAWQYPPPLDLSPANLDWDTWLGRAPKRAFDPLLFARWRAYRDFGTGVAGDLLVHLISGFMYVMDINAPPSRASSVGGIRRWKDGRDMPDVHAVVYDYGGLPVYMRLNLGTSIPDSYRIQGSKGMLELTGNSIVFTPQLGIDTSPSYYASSFPRAMREQYQRQWRAENEARIAALPMQESITIRGPNADSSLRSHMSNFFDAVRTRGQTIQPALFGHNAALACHMANEAYFKQTTVRWDDKSRKIVA